MSVAHASHLILTGNHDHDANTIYSVEAELSSTKKTNIDQGASEWSGETVIDFDRVADTCCIDNEFTWQVKNLIWMTDEFPALWQGPGCEEGVALACTVYEQRTDFHILGPDIAVNFDVYPYNSSCSTTDSYVDFWSIIAHEFGHFGGLGHAHYPPLAHPDEDESIMIDPGGNYEDWCRRHTTVWDNNRMNENHPHY